MNLKFAKVRDVKSPVRGHRTDAGIDFFMPMFTDDFIRALEEKNPEVNYGPDFIELAPHSDVLIPSGIKVNLHSTESAKWASGGNFNFMLIGANKSGIATKKKLVYGAHVIDWDYQGEIHIHLINTSTEVVKLKENDKLIQFILVPVLAAELSETTATNLFSKETNRGEGGFGSTDQK